LYAQNEIDLRCKEAPQTHCIGSTQKKEGFSQPYPIFKIIKAEAPSPQSNTHLEARVEEIRYDDPVVTRNSGGHAAKDQTDTN
jgi:hypothetical protein